MTPQEKYNKAHTRIFSLRLNRKYDAQILRMLEQSENQHGLIKVALLEYYNHHRISAPGKNECSAAELLDLRLRITLAEMEQAVARIRGILEERNPG